MSVQAFIDALLGLETGLSITTYSSEVLATPALVSYYKLDERRGTLARDEVRTQNGAYVGGVTLDQPGAFATQLNSAVDFDGVDGRVEAPHTAAHLLTTGGSIEAWIFPRTTGATDFGRIVDKSSGGSGAEGFSLYLEEVDPTNRRLRGNLAGDATVVASDASSVTLDVWQYVAMTWNALGQVTFYINGQASGIVDQQSGDPAGIVTTNALNIGRASTIFRPFDGLIDEVAVYNVPLSADQVAKHFAAGSKPMTVKRAHWGVPPGELVDLPAVVNVFTEPERMLGFGLTQARETYTVEIQLAVAKVRPDDVQAQRIATEFWFAMKDAFRTNQDLFDGTIADAMQPVLRGADPTVPVLITHGGTTYIGLHCFLEMQAITS